MPAIQFNLKVNNPGDKYEREADRVAEQVMRMPEPAVQRKSCACGKAAGPDGICADCKRKQLNIQRKASGEGGQTAVTPAIGPSLFRKDDAKEDPTKKTKLSLKAQKAFWDDLHAFFPNEGRKLAGSGYDPSVSHLEVSFLEGLIGDASHSPPSMKVGKDYLGEKDADKRKAWIKAEIQKINKWRVDTGRIDDQDVGDADVTKWIDKLDLSGKLGVLRKMEVRKIVNYVNSPICAKNEIGRFS